LTVGLDDFRGPFQPMVLLFYDSMIKIAHLFRKREAMVQVLLLPGGGEGLLQGRTESQKWLLKGLCE